ncbi:hypothetical protein FRC07_006668 [Ceratobasidium sp. 392]|nr:hypothetical protein FRC07_006668 [Ceratobasidium sp. 392]
MLDILEQLLNHDIIATDRGGAKLDGVVLGDNGANCMVVEIVNEVGTGRSDPSVQGAVMLERPAIQPLTDYLWVANNPRSQSRFYHLARTFWALSRSITDLKTYYASLQPGFSQFRFDPHIRQYSSEGETVDFSYVRSLGEHGSLKTVFQARTESLVGQPAKDIVVKFPETYHSRAHQLLAEAGLAPKLLFDGFSIPGAPKPSGRFMIVMEYVKGRDLTEAGEIIPSCVRESIEEAISILHRHNIVFGDLRRPNVLAVEDADGHAVKGMLVDFDWCGINGQSRYPAAMNAKEIEWPSGVNRNTIMMLEHDIAVLQALL